MELEDLPNELFDEIFAYINDLDLFRIFFRLNRRFTELVMVPTRIFHLNFQSITRKDMDWICQEPFRKIVWQIRSLRLSDDDDTPYQSDQFLCDNFRFYQFFSLETLSLYHIRCHLAFYEILTYLPSLPHLTSLKIDQIHLNFDDLGEFSGPIWSSSSLTDLYISKSTFVSEYFLSELVKSVSLKRVHLLECSFLLSNLQRLFECTPLLEELSIVINQDATDLDINEYLSNLLPLLRILNLKFDGHVNGLEYILQFMSTLQQLKIEFVDWKIDGYQWQEMICNRLLHLQIFHLKMSFYINIDHHSQMELDQFIESYRISYWIDERQLFFRCQWYAEYHDCQEYYLVVFYSLPYVFDTLTYVDPMYFKSTCSNQTNSSSYSTVHTFCLLPNEKKENVTDISLHLSNVHSLILGYKLDNIERFSLRLDQLITLNLQYLHGQVHSNLQILLNHASQLQTIVFNKNNWSLFFLTNQSVRRLMIRDGIYYNIQQCEQLCSSAFFHQCEVLEMNLRTPSSVIDLIKKMPNLRSLIFRCERDQWNKNQTSSSSSSSEKHDELLKWLKRYLSSEYIIERGDCGAIRLWIS